MVDSRESLFVKLIIPFHRYQLLRLNTVTIRRSKRECANAYMLVLHVARRLSMCLDRCVM
jgi:hypothetical protein